MNTLTKNNKHLFMNTLAAAVGGATLVLSGLAVAGDSGQDKSLSDRMRYEFKQVDQDADGRLSWSELEKRYDQRMESLDWDKDDVLENFDSDGDSYINQNEFASLATGLRDASLNTPTTAMGSRDGNKAGKTMSKAEPGYANDRYTMNKKDRMSGSQDAQSSSALHEVKDDDMLISFSGASAKAETVEDMKVYNLDNKKIGEVEEIIVNDQGEVNALVIEVGGFMGMNSRDVLVEAGALNMANDRIIWNSKAGKENFKNMPEYDDRYASVN